MFAIHLNQAIVRASHNKPAKAQHKIANRELMNTEKPIPTQRGKRFIKMCRIIIPM